MPPLISLSPLKITPTVKTYAGVLDRVYSESPAALGIRKFTLDGNSATSLAGSGTAVGYALASSVQWHVQTSTNVFHYIEAVGSGKFGMFGLPTDLSYGAFGADLSYQVVSPNRYAEYILAPTYLGIGLSISAAGFRCFKVTPSGIVSKLGEWSNQYLNYFIAPAVGPVVGTTMTLLPYGSQHKVRPSSDKVQALFPALAGVTVVPWIAD